MTKKQKEQMTEYLNERWDIYCTTGCSADLTFYNGIIKAIEILGYDWERNEHGVHIIY